MKPLQIGVLAVALSAGAAFAQPSGSDIRVIVAKQTGDNRLLIENSTLLPQGVVVRGLTADPKLGFSVTTPLTVVRVPDGTLPTALLLPADLRGQIDAMASRFPETPGRTTLNSTEDCWGACTFILNVYYDSGASSYFVFSRYPSSYNGHDTDYVSSMAGYRHEYVADIVHAESSAGWLSGFDVVTSMPEGGSRSCFRPAPDNACPSGVWGHKYGPSTLSGTMVLESGGRTAIRPCNPNQECEPPIIDGSAVSITVH